MIAAVVENGTVVNIIEADSLDVLPGLVDGTGANIGDGWNGTQFIKPTPPAPTVPEIISPRQFRQALNFYGFRTNVDNAVSTSTDQNLKDWYQYATSFERHHQQVLAMAQQLGYTSAQLDQVWTYGATL